MTDEVLDLGRALPSSRHRTRLLVATIFLVLSGALIVLTVHMAMPKRPQQRHRSILSVAIPQAGLDPAMFRDIPDAADDRTANAIAQTSSRAAGLGTFSIRDAIARNAAMPAAGDGGPAASPFRVPIGSGTSYTRALDCMTAAIYYEAANEPVDGQRAVAQVVINRMRHLAYPHSICGVVYQGWDRAAGCQFSFTCDGSLARGAAPALWARARRIADMALTGYVYAPVGLATHYHADYVVPYWAPTLLKQVGIGQHIFYRWPGAWGMPRAFLASYDRMEPDVRAAIRIVPPTGTPGDGVDVAAPPVDTTARPVLVAATSAVKTAPVPTERAAPKPETHVYFISRSTLSRTDASPAARQGGVTGGVIMPGGAVLPGTPPWQVAQTATPATIPRH